MGIKYIDDQLGGNVAVKHGVTTFPSRGTLAIDGDNVDVTDAGTHIQVDVHPEKRLATVADLRAHGGAVGERASLAGDAGGEFERIASGTDDGGTAFVATGYGTTGAAWRRVFSGPVNVRWFGAVGDGDITGGVGAVTGTNDSTAFQRAIDAAAATGEREVLVPSRAKNKGYRIRDTITMPSSVCLRGISPASTVAAVVPSLFWDPATPDADLDCILVEPDTENAGGSIENFLIFQSSTVALTGAGTGIHLKHSGTFGLKPSHFHIRDVFVDAFDADPWTWGIQFEGIPDSLPTDYLRDCYIERTRVTGCALPGLPKVFTSDHTTDTLTSTAHGMNNDDEVRLFTTSALPAPLGPLTTYLVKNKTANTFQLAPVGGGGVIPLTDNGTGVHNVSRRVDFKSGGGGIKLYATANIWLDAVALNNQCRILIDSDDAEYFSTVVYLTTCMIDELEIGNAQDVYVRGGRYDAIQCHSLAQNNIFMPDYVAVKPVPLGGVNNQYVAVHAPTADFVSTGAFASYDTASGTVVSLLRLSGGVIRLGEIGGFPFTFGGAPSIGSAGEGDLVTPNGRGLWSTIAGGGGAKRMIAMAGGVGADAVYLAPDADMDTVAGRNLSWRSALRGFARVSNALTNTSQTLAVSLGVTTDIDFTVWAHFQFRKNDGTMLVATRRAVFSRVSGTLTRVDDAVESLGSDRPSAGVAGWSVDIAKNGNNAVELLVTAENNVTVITDYEWSRTA